MGRVDRFFALRKAASACQLSCGPHRCIAKEVAQREAADDEVAPGEDATTIADQQRGFNFTFRTPNRKDVVELKITKRKGWPPEPEKYVCLLYLRLFPAAGATRKRLLEKLKAYHQSLKTTVLAQLRTSDPFPMFQRISSELGIEVRRGQDTR